MYSHGCKVVPKDKWVKRIQMQRLRQQCCQAFSARPCLRTQCVAATEHAHCASNSAAAPACKGGKGRNSEDDRTHLNAQGEADVEQLQQDTRAEAQRETPECGLHGERKGGYARDLILLSASAVQVQQAGRRVFKG